MIASPRLENSSHISRCSWRISAPFNHRLKFTLLFYNVSSFESCSNSEIVVFDGLSGSSNVLERFSCPKLSRALFTSGRHMMVEATLPMQKNYLDFIAVYDVVGIDAGTWKANFMKHRQMNFRKESKDKFSYDIFVMITYSIIYLMYISALVCKSAPSLTSTHWNWFLLISTALGKHPNSSKRPYFNKYPYSASVIALLARVYSLPSSCQYSLSINFSCHFYSFWFFFSFWVNYTSKLCFVNSAVFQLIKKYKLLVSASDLPSDTKSQISTRAPNHYCKCTNGFVEQNLLM